VRVTVFVEGGGKGSYTECRQGFRRLIEKVVSEGVEITIAACGDGNSAYKDFIRAPGPPAIDVALLLVDSEGPVAEGKDVWEHLQSQRDGQWSRPSTIPLDAAHLMVQSMETWLVADPDALRKYYIRDFRSGSLPKAHNLEGVSKADVLDCLKRATEPTPKKTYHKTRDGLALLASIDPAKVRSRSPHADRFFTKLEECASSS
jgi:hypothetical protein